jgi:molecular chaperone HtpG
VGTTITLHIGDNAESKEFLKAYKVRETLKKHCEFMQYPIFLDDRERAEKNAQEIIDNQKLADGDKNKREMTPYTPEQVNQTDPLWTKDPNSLKDEDYLAFYRSLFPMDQEPLFWIHLNVDHPFHLQGVLYFPKLNPMKPVTERNIRLYCKQVFVSDDVKNIMPEYLGLLKGAVDSTDIPLNVSRSSLQGDPNIKKISNYISKRVAEALKKLFKNDRPKYEKIWEDIQLFVKYGVISDDKFDQVMRNFTLFKNSENKLVTLEEYQSSIPATFREKLKGKVITFEKDKSDQSLKSQLLQEGIHTIETEEFIDPHFTQHVEMKSWSQPNENDGEKAKDKETSSLKFVAIESEMENLLTSTEEVSPDDVKIKDIFQEVLFGKIAKLTKNENDQNNDDNDNDENDFMGKMGKTDIDVKRLTNASSPAYFKLDEQMKRMQAMTRQMGLNRNDFPVKKTLVINPKNSLIQNTLKIWEKGDKELVGKIAHHVQDLAQISSTGLKAEEKEAFVKRSTELIDQLSKLAF